MTDLTLYTPTTFDLRKATQHGDKIYRTNENMRDVANMMSDKKFREFFTKHFQTWDDVKTTMMFMKMYEFVDFMFPNKSIKVKLYVLNEIVKNSDTRSRMIKLTQDWMSDEKVQKKLLK